MNPTRKIYLFSAANKDETIKILGLYLTDHDKKDINLTKKFDAIMAFLGDEINCGI